MLIVGGGIVGAGALLDAASRGLRAALVEQSDIAAGTSSRSSRLIHGGLRYLEQLQFPLVREALAERRRLLRNAPHLVTLQPLLFPIYGAPFLTKAFYDAGLTLYDILGARHDGGWHKRLNVRDTLAIAPSLRTKGLRGGLLFHDGMEDDARFTLAVLRTALASEAAPIAVTRVRATGVRTDPRSGQVRGLAVPGPHLGGDPPGRGTQRGRCHGGLGRRPDPPVRQPDDAPAAQPRCPPGRAPRAHPGHGRDDHPGAGQDHLPRALAGPLADRHDRRPVRGAAGPADGGRAGRWTSCWRPSTRRSTSTCAGTMSSARMPGCGRSSPRRAVRPSRPRASTA